MALARKKEKRVEPGLIEAAVDLREFGRSAKGIGVLGVTVVEVEPVGLQGTGEVGAEALGSVNMVKC